MKFAQELRAEFSRWGKEGIDSEKRLRRLPPDDLLWMDHLWEFWARDDQLPPPGDWLTWLVLGGRGAGKTRAGAEWVRAIALGLAPYAGRPVGPIALVGETLALLPCLGASLLDSRLPNVAVRDGALDRCLPSGGEAIGVR